MGGHSFSAWRVKACGQSVVMNEIKQRTVETALVRVYSSVALTMNRDERLWRSGMGRDGRRGGTILGLQETKHTWSLCFLKSRYNGAIMGVTKAHRRRRSFFTAVDARVHVILQFQLKPNCCRSGKRKTAPLKQVRGFSIPGISRSSRWFHSNP